MAEVRCPMCGKPNPAEAEVCRYCQARLKPLIAPQQPETPPPSGGAGQPSEAGGGEMDWLSSLRSDDEPSSMEGASEKEEFGSGDVSDWLTRLGQVEETPEAEGESTPAQEAIPDWLAKPTEGGDPNIPDWMEDLGISGESTTDGGPQPEAAPGETPDWLQRVRARQQEEEPEPAPGEESSPFGSLPDWSAPPPQETQPASEQGLPDWLSTIGSAETPASEAEETLLPSFPSWSDTPESVPSETEQPAEIPAEAAQVPDWLSQYSQPPENQPFSSPDTGEAGQSPDWMSQLGQAAEEQPAGAELADLETPDMTAEQLPEWLTSEQEQTVSPFTSGAEGKENVPDWLAKLGPTAEEAEAAAAASSAFLIDNEDEKAFLFGETLPGEEKATPGWLSQVSAEEAPPSQFVEEEPGGEEGLSPAQLPSWLEAMRPVEAAALPVFKDESDTRVEGAGPLSGLRGTLQAEPDIARVRKPPIYSVKMQLSESHQARLNLLDDLLKSEGEARPAMPRALVSAQPVLRWVITLLLAIVVFYQLVANDKQEVPLLVDAPPQEVKDTNGYINSLASGDPVLVAFDYEPAFTGELKRPVEVVLAHLKEKNAFVTVVSTSPTGVALANNSLTSAQITGTQTTNFGFIPGGPGGLLGFAMEPRRILRYALGSLLDEQPGQGWAAPALGPANVLNDFALVMVITDDPDTGRSWIEQVAPSLPNSPLIMVTSAQAAPLLKPYYPQQLKGLISGLEGAAAYLTTRNVPLPVWKEWDAYSFGLLAAVVLILGGGLTNLFSAVLARSKGKVAE